MRNFINNLRRKIALRNFEPYAILEGIEVPEDYEEVVSEEKLEQNRLSAYIGVFKNVRELLEKQIENAEPFEEVGYWVLAERDHIFCYLGVEASHIKQGEPCCVKMECSDMSSSKHCEDYVFGGSREAVVDWLANPTSIEIAVKIYHDLRMRCMEV